MSTSRSVSGSILTPNGWVLGELTFDGGLISAIEGVALGVQETPKPPFIVPGFIDLHVHGGGGFDCLDGETSVREMAHFHARHGTVALLPTTSTATVDAIEEGLRGIGAVHAKPEFFGAEVLGAHVEGPFINPGCLGAQADGALDGDVELVRSWMKLCPIRVATVAPEIAGGMEVVRTLAKGGVRVQIGHSLADDAILRRAFTAGCTGFTHLYNAMSPVAHKTSGIAAYALAFGEYAEIIADLRHVHPTALVAAYRSIPFLYAITDAQSVAGLPDGEYRLNKDNRAIRKDGLDVFLTSDPSVRAGSAATMDAIFRSLVSLGLPMEAASSMTSTRAAQYLGASALGKIQPGMAASVVLLKTDLQVDSVFVNGQQVSGKRSVR